MPIVDFFPWLVVLFSGAFLLKVKWSTQNEKQQRTHTWKISYMLINPRRFFSQLAHSSLLATPPQQNLKRKKKQKFHRCNITCILVIWSQCGSHFNWFFLVRFPRQPTSALTIRRTLSSAWKLNGPVPFEVYSKFDPNSKCAQYLTNSISSTG